MVVLLVSFGCNRDAGRKPIRIGYLICNSEQETISRFQPLNRYLTDRLGVDVVMVPVEAVNLEAHFKAGDFDFIHTNSLIHIILQQKLGAELVACEKRGNFGSRTVGTIIARNGSGLSTVADLKGKRLAFGSPFAPAGYLAEYDLLLAAGVNPETDLGHYTTPAGAYKHEKLVYGVLFGSYDAATVPALDLEVMIREGKIAADDLVILAQSKLIPYCAFTAAKGVNRATVIKMREALIALRPESSVTLNGEQLKVLKAAWIDGYEELAESEFEPLRQMAKRVNVPQHTGQ
jgi:phosphonate transport system substrate-binding protein